MGVQVLEFSGRRIAAKVRHELHSDLFLAAEPRLHAWTGASGKRHIHTVHSLFGCPELTDVVYVIARRAADGTRTALLVDATASTIGSLNLAEIRQSSALLDADEIHVYSARSERERSVVLADLQAAVQCFAPVAATGHSSRLT